MAEAEKEAWDEDWRFYDLPGPGRVLLCENCSDHEERVLDEEGPRAHQSDAPILPRPVNDASSPSLGKVYHCPPVWEQALQETLRARSTPGAVTNRKAGTLPDRDRELALRDLMPLNGSEQEIKDALRTTDQAILSSPI